MTAHQQLKTAGTLIEELDLVDNSGLAVSQPFPSTAGFEEKIYLCEGLEKKELRRMLLEPLLPFTGVWPSDEESDTEDKFAPRSFHLFDAVSSAFGPGGGNAQMDLKVHKNAATFPNVREMILVTEKGYEIEIRPRCRPRTKVLRGCVELGIAEWMKKQQELPPGDERRHVVQSATVRYNINGEAKDEEVWLWRGLEQDPVNPHIFKIFL